MKKALQVFCCLACLCPLLVHAIRVPGLYEAEVIVVNQSTEYRSAAIRACLSRVLVKLTGERDVSRIAELQPILEGAGQFVQQYRYREMRAESIVTTGQDLPAKWPYAKRRRKPE